MARVSEVLLLGGANRVVAPDALVGFANSPEVGVKMRIRTKRFSPIAPASDTIGKRMFVQVEHPHGVALDVTPIVDGQSQPAMLRFFSRPAFAGDPKRESFLVPLVRPVDGGRRSAAIRGATFGVLLESTMPQTEFFIESLQIEANPLQGARGREEGD